MFVVRSAVAVIIVVGVVIVVHAVVCYYYECCWRAGYWPYCVQICCCAWQWFEGWEYLFCECVPCVRAPSRKRVASAATSFVFAHNWGSCKSRGCYRSAAAVVVACALVLQLLLLVVLLLRLVSSPWCPHPRCCHRLVQDYFCYSCQRPYMYT